MNSRMLSGPTLTAGRQRTMHRARCNSPGSSAQRHFAAELAASELTRHGQRPRRQVAGAAIEAGLLRPFLFIAQP
jgi:hypothetical protein